MIELSDMEIDEVTGAFGFFTFIGWGNALVEFTAGFIDGVSAASQ